MVVEENKQKRQIVRDGGRVSENPQLREMFNANLDQIKKYRAEKRGLIDRLKEL